MGYPDWERHGCTDHTPLPQYACEVSGSSELKVTLCTLPLLLDGGLLPGVQAASESATAIAWSCVNAMSYGQNSFICFFVLHASCPSPRSLLSAELC